MFCQQRTGTSSFFLGAMVDSKHVGIMLSTWATTKRVGNFRKRRVGSGLVTVQYPEYQHWYYYARHAVDDNNNRRQGSEPFEESFGPRRWDQRHFGYVVATCITNTEMLSNLAFHQRGEKAMSSAEFRRSLIESILSKLKIHKDGDYDTPRRSKKPRTSISPNSEHYFCQVSGSGMESAGLSANSPIKSTDVDSGDAAHSVEHTAAVISR